MRLAQLRGPTPVRGIGGDFFKDVICFAGAFILIAIICAMLDKLGEFIGWIRDHL
jgi:hypothetical protein